MHTRHGNAGRTAPAESPVHAGRPGRAGPLLHPGCPVHAARPAHAAHAARLARLAVLTAVAAAAAALFGGCAPVVTHAPALRPGTAVSVTAAFTAVAHTCYDASFDDGYGGRQTYRECPEGDAGPWPLFLSVSRTWKAEPLGSGFRAGLDLPPWPGWEALLGAQVSGFWQAPKPREGALDWGAGTIVSPVWVAPYLQLGRIDASGRGWFTTQMLAVPHPLLEGDEDFGPGWHPSVAYQVPCPRCERRQGVGGVVRLYVSGGIARTPIDPWARAEGGRYWTRLISAGVVVEAAAPSGLLW
jgi:hypothetical protein